MNLFERLRKSYPEKTDNEIKDAIHNASILAGGIPLTESQLYGLSKWYLSPQRTVTGVNEGVSGPILFNSLRIVKEGGNVYMTGLVNSDELFEINPPEVISYTRDEFKILL